MPKIDLTTLDSELKKGQTRPIYAIVGAEAHLAREAFAKIREKVVGSSSDMSVKTFDGKEADAEKVICELKNISLLGDRLLVVIRDAEKLSKTTLDSLAGYAEKPSSHSTLVLIAEKIDGRSRFMTTASKTGAVIECKPLYQDKVPAWLAMEVRKRGRQISMDASSFMAEMTGSNLGELTQALERVMLFIGEKKTIDLKDVEQVIAETSRHDVFELADAVGAKNMKKAISLLHNILSNNESPVFLLTMIARHLRILAKAKEVAGRMNDQTDIARYLGVHPYFLKNYLAQTKNFASAELKKAFKILHRTDRELKSSKLSGERILEKAIFELVGHGK